MGEFSLVPIRYEDRFEIMKWRNEQIYHLRQDKLLTEEDQERYFQTVVSQLFEQESPQQLLFSFLRNGICVGYGGLVHISWVDKHAEISFILNTALEETHFDEFWSTYLKMLEELAFEQLQLHKIFTYAYDLRRHLFQMLEKNNFIKEATLKEHTYFNQKYIDVIIHSKINHSK